MIPKQINKPINGEITGSIKLNEFPIANPVNGITNTIDKSIIIPIIHATTGWKKVEICSITESPVTQVTFPTTYRLTTDHNAVSATSHARLYPIAEPETRLWIHTERLNTTASAIEIV